MRRAPIVIVATVAGFVAVLSYHTSAAPSVLGAGSVATRPTSTPAAGAGSRAAGSSGSGGSGSSAGSSGSGSSGSAGSGTGGSGAASSGTDSSSEGGSASTGAARSATGNTVTYFYGSLAVEVSATGSRITRVQIASLDDGGNFRSQSIDDQAIPVLEDEVLSAQSANIQAVSGASYTSQGFIDSLQSALSKLGIA